MLGVKMLREVVCQIFLSGMPCDIEVSNFHLICDPKEILFHGARALFFDSVVCDGNCGGVVAMHWCRGLFVPDFFKGEP